MNYWFTLLFLSFCCYTFSKLATVWLVVNVRKLKIVDDPSHNLDRKDQKIPIPLLGATGFIVSCGISMVFIWASIRFNLFDLRGILIQNMFYVFHLGWIIIGGLVLSIGGFLDDKFTLSSKWLISYITVGIAITVFLGGIKIENLSYPFDQFLPNISSGVSILPSILAYLWILCCVSATKFLDGHDGLVSSVGIMSLITIGWVSTFSNVDQPFIFMVSIIWASGIAGFLPFNLPNAKIYLGEGGSEIIGFVIGVLSILSGAKIATASSIIGWFVFDILLVLYLRLRAKKSPFSAGREHWHFRLVDIGMTKWQVLILTLVILLISSSLGLFLPTIYKPLAILGQFIMLILIFIYTQKKNKI